MIGGRRPKNGRDSDQGYTLPLGMRRRREAIGFKPHPEIIKTGYRIFQKLAAKADVIVNALPLTETTRGSLDAAFFDAMKDGSYYITVGRGGTTDTDALMAALESGKLAGAGLDVTDPEPLPADHPLWGAPNLVISPHTAARSPTCRFTDSTVCSTNGGSPFWPVRSTPCLISANGSC